MTYFASETRRERGTVIIVGIGKAHPFSALVCAEIHALQSRPCTFNLRERLHIVRHRNGAKVIVRNGSCSLAHVKEAQHAFAVGIKIALHGRVKPKCRLVQRLGRRCERWSIPFFGRNRNRTVAHVYDSIARRDDCSERKCPIAFAGLVKHTARLNPYCALLLHRGISLYIYIHPIAPADNNIGGKSRCATHECCCKTTKAGTIIWIHTPSFLFRQVDKIPKSFFFFKRNR